MLQLTDAAATTLGEACRQQGMDPSSSGVRVAGAVDESGNMALDVSLESEPAASDEVSDQGPVRVFVASEVAEPLADLEIDVAETPDGPQLQLREQETSD